MTESPLPEADRLAATPHPRFTAKLIGQNLAQEQFLTAFNAGRTHHAWLISGPRGIGKATLAWQIAQFLLAQPSPKSGRALPAPTSFDIPADHPIRRRIQSLGEPRLFLCRRPWDEKTKTHRKFITIDTIRDLKSFFTLSAADGGWRVAIIDAADELNIQAANALLKILEEPPVKSIILLVCHQPAALLPTLRSRCQTLRCQPLAAPDIMQVLNNNDIEAPNDPQMLHLLSDGSAGTAIRLQTDGGFELYTELTELISTAPGLNRTKAIALADSCVGKSAIARYDTMVELILFLLARLAKFGAMRIPDQPQADTKEEQLFNRLAPNAAAGRRWADLHQNLSSRSAHARTVNIDPGSMILDMLLKSDATARTITKDIK